MHRIWWTRHMMAVHGPPPMVSQGIIDLMTAMGGDLTAEEWSRRLDIHPVTIRYCMAWFGLMWKPTVYKAVTVDVPI